MMLLQDAPGEIKAFLKGLGKLAGFTETTRGYVIRLPDVGVAGGGRRARASAASGAGGAVFGGLPVVTGLERMSVDGDVALGSGA